MFSISWNGIIQISRGDTCYGNLFINIGTELEPEAYQLGDKDALYFGVMEANTAFRDALICKKITKKDRVPGDAPVVGEALRENESAAYGMAYFTREESDEGVGYLNDGIYRYEPAYEIPEEHPADVYFPLYTYGADYPGYYRIHFETKDTEHLVPGVYYYETKLARWESTEDEYGEENSYCRVDTIVPKTKFIIHD